MEPINKHRLDYFPADCQKIELHGILSGRRFLGGCLSGANNLAGQDHRWLDGTGSILPVPCCKANDRLCNSCRSASDNIVFFIGLVLQNLLYDTGVHIHQIWKRKPVLHSIFPYFSAFKCRAGAARRNDMRRAAGYTDTAFTVSSRCLTNLINS